MGKKIAALNVAHDGEQILALLESLLQRHCSFLGALWSRSVDDDDGKAVSLRKRLVELRLALSRRYIRREEILGIAIHLEMLEHENAGRNSEHDAHKHHGQCVAATELNKPCKEGR